MQLKDKINQVQAHLQDLHLDGWLLYDFQKRNDIALDFLELPPNAHLTRRLFYWIPKLGEPAAIISAIESHHYQLMPGKKLIYRDWKALKAHLQELLQDKKRIAMEYSQDIPTISKVDGGTIDLIRSFSIEVVSSDPLVQFFTSALDEKQIASHFEAMAFLEDLLSQTWKKIADSLKKKQTLSEYDVQQWMLKKMDEKGFVADGAPICATNANSANPHYCPEKKSSVIQKGDFILLDVWAKKNAPRAIYADITQVGMAVGQLSGKVQEVFEIVRAARDAAIAFLKRAFQSGQKVHGYEVDQVCRQVIKDAGYGDFFIHRTGHNIGEHTHGLGTHMDDFETHDSRLILPFTCFSIEPGIYLPDEFGVRLECNVLTKEKDILVTGNQPTCTRNC